MSVSGELKRNRNSIPRRTQHRIEGDIHVSIWFTVDANAKILNEKRININRTSINCVGCSLQMCKWKCIVYSRSSGGDGALMWQPYVRETLDHRLFNSFHLFNFSVPSCRRAISSVGNTIIAQNNLTIAQIWMPFIHKTPYEHTILTTISALFRVRFHVCGKKRIANICCVVGFCVDVIASSRLSDSVVSSWDAKTESKALWKLIA